LRNLNLRSSVPKADATPRISKSLSEKMSNVATYLVGRNFCDYVTIAAVSCCKTSTRRKCFDFVFFGNSSAPIFKSRPPGCRRRSAVLRNRMAEVHILSSSTFECFFSNILWDCAFEVVMTGSLYF
jgi:hypothetical protein